MSFFGCNFPKTKLFSLGETIFGVYFKNVWSHCGHTSARFSPERGPQSEKSGSTICRQKSRLKIGGS
jgi:hypothetical protein